MYKATNIMSCEDISTHCKEMQSFIEAEYNTDNPNAIIERASSLEGYMALSGKMLADAKYNYNTVLNSCFIEAVREGNSNHMKPITLNKYIDSLCRDYSYLVDWTDRINRSITHQLDFSRTLISKLKEEMKQLQYANT